MTVYEKKVEKKVEIHTVSRFSKNTLLNLKPGLTQLDFRYFQFSFISTIIKIQLFSYFKKYE